LGALAGKIAVEAVMDARTKSTEARISCSPLACQGKCVDRIQSSSGIMAIRLNVMELGKFIMRTRDAWPISFIIAPEGQKQ
jgi:hypothetical protein